VIAYVDAMSSPNEDLIAWAREQRQDMIRRAERLESRTLQTREPLGGIGWTDTSEETAADLRRQIAALDRLLGNPEAAKPPASDPTRFDISLAPFGAKRRGS